MYTLIALKQTVADRQSGSTEQQDTLDIALTSTGVVEGLSLEAISLSS